MFKIHISIFYGLMGGAIIYAAGLDSNSSANNVGESYSFISLHLSKSSFGNDKSQNNSIHSINNTDSSFTGVSHRGLSGTLLTTIGGVYFGIKLSKTKNISEGTYYLESYITFINQDNRNIKSIRIDSLSFENITFPSYSANFGDQKFSSSGLQNAGNMHLSNWLKKGSGYITNPKLNGTLKVNNLVIEFYDGESKTFTGSILIHTKKNN